MLGLRKRSANGNTVAPNTKLLLQQAHYQGPLPLPDHFERYNEVLPGSAERILMMAEKEQIHRLSQEQESLKFQCEIIKADSEHKKLSLKLTVFGLVPMCMATAVGLALCGSHVAAGVVGGTTVVTIASFTLIGKLSKENKEKNKDSQ